MKLNRRKLRKLILEEIYEGRGKKATKPEDIPGEIVESLTKAYEEHGAPGFIFQLLKEYTMPVYSAVTLYDDLPALKGAYDQHGIEGVLRYVLANYSIERKS